MAIKTSKGPAGHAGGLFGKADGKGAKSASLLPGQKSTLTKGDPMSRVMGQYGKGHDIMAQSQGAAGVDPSVDMPNTDSHPGMAGPVRNDDGGIKRNPRYGGLAAGKMAGPTTLMSD